MARTASEKGRRRRRGAATGEATDRAFEMLTSSGCDDATHTRFMGLAVARALLKRAAFNPSTAVSAAELQSALGCPSRDYIDTAAQRFNAADFAIIEAKCPIFKSPTGKYFITCETRHIESEIAWLESVAEFAARRLEVLRPMLAPVRVNPVWSVKPESTTKGCNGRR